MIKLTLDTNCIINLLDLEAETPTSTDALSEILRYAMDGDVNVAITTRVEDDVSNDKVAERREKMLKTIRMFPVIGTGFRLDLSRLDGADFLTDDKHNALEKELQAILFPGLDKKSKHYGNKVNDIDHLVGHAVGKREIFVTDDGDLLRRADKVKESLSIAIMSPSQCLEYLDSRGKKNVLVEEFFDKLNTLKALLLRVADNGSDEQSEQKYMGLRTWLLRKFPKILDGLVSFRQHMKSIPLPDGRRMMDTGDVLSLQHLPRLFEKLFAERTLEEKINKLWGSGTGTFVQHYYSPEVKKDLVEKDFNSCLDLLESYIGYLE